MQRRKAKKNDFSPNQAYIDNAVKDYLKRGGKITAININDRSIEDILHMRGTGASADSFLLYGYL